MTLANAREAARAARGKLAQGIDPIEEARLARDRLAAEKAAAKSIILSDEQRYRMVAEAAYYRAESNQFKSDPLRDWIEAEKDIAALLNGEN